MDKITSFLRMAAAALIAFNAGMTTARLIREHQADTVTPVLDLIAKAAKYNAERSTPASTERGQR